MRTTRATRKRLWPWLSAAVVLNITVVGGLGAATARLAAFDQSPAPGAGVSETAPATAAAGTRERTPAADLLARVIAAPARELFGPGYTAADPLEQIYPRVLATCPAVKVGPATVSSRTAQGDGFGLLLQLWAMPAGAGTSTVTQMRRDLGECVTPPRFSADTEAGAAWFTASASAGTQTVTWFVFARGDVVASLAFTGNRLVPLSQLRSAADRLDTLLAAQLEPVCADLSPTEQDATRNPWLGAYAPYARPVHLKVSPTLRERPQVDTADVHIPHLTVPEPVEHPDLAPVLDLTESMWQDNDGDGVVDFAPTFDDAPRGTAPVYADPAAFTADVSGYSDPGPEPLEPPAPAGSFTALIPDADITGPGCGWTFTGQRPAMVDQAAVSAQASAAWKQALATAGARRFEAWSAQEQWRAQYTAWVRAEAAYAPVREYLAAKDAAVQAAQAARKDYDDAHARYVQALAHPPAPVDPPPVTPSAPPTPPTTPSPTPTSTPTSPTTEGTQP